jgi:hypothetical protein
MSQPVGMWAGAIAGLAAVCLWVVPMVAGRSYSWLSGATAWLTVVVAVTVAAGFAVVALTMDAFRQRGLPDLPTYLVSDDLVGLILMLIWLPASTTAFGTAAGAAATAVRRTVH